MISKSLIPIKSFYTFFQTLEKKKNNKSNETIFCANKQKVNGYLNRKKKNLFSLNKSQLKSYIV